MARVYENLDSKYKFVVLASGRSKQLIDGARPKIQSSSKKATIIAMEEVLAGLIESYNIDDKKPGVHDEEDGKE